MMKVKELITKLQEYPEDMEVVFHYRSDLCNVYDNDFVVFNETLDYCSFSTEWGTKEVYARHRFSPYDALVDYKDGKEVYEKVPFTEKNAIVLEVSDR